MTSLRWETSSPSLDLCETCIWKLDRYGTTNLKDVTQRNKASKKPGNRYYAIRKTCSNCGIEIPDEEIFRREMHIHNGSESAKVSWGKIFKSKSKETYLIILTVTAALIGWYLISMVYSDNHSKASKIILNTELSKLKQKYPNQYPELWHNVLKITNYTKPHVQVLILLYKENSEVAECFAKDLVKLINRIINKSGFAIYEERGEVAEYGEELKHYLNLVRKHNHLIVLQLNKIPGNMAKMFHFLCDDVPSSIRPSFFIFTVEDKDRETIKDLRPLARAGRILRSAWSNLVENELHPIISRVVRNVADILPENITC